jgi:hypothetical protein
MASFHILTVTNLHKVSYLDQAGMQNVSVSLSYQDKDKIVDSTGSDSISRVLRALCGSRVGLSVPAIKTSIRLSNLWYLIDLPVLRDTFALLLFAKCPTS